MFDQNQFSADKKHGNFLLQKFEAKMKEKLLPFIPLGIETYHLTLMTVLWSALYLFASYLSQKNLHWLWFASLIVVLQYITDLFDGALGRFRNTGLIRWGYFMDHLLDFIFLSAIIVGHSLLAPPGMAYDFMVLLLMIATRMLVVALSFAATNQLRVYFWGVGPSELRVLIVLVNILTIFKGPSHYPYSIKVASFFCGLGVLALIIQTSTLLWKMDMAQKNQKNNLANASMNSAHEPNAKRFSSPLSPSE